MVPSLRTLAPTSATKPRVVLIDGRGDHSPSLHHQITNRPTDFGREGIRFHLGIAGDLEGRKEELGVGIIRNASARDPLEGITRKILVDRQGRGHQGVGVHLGAVVEDNPVLVKDINLTLGLNPSINVGGIDGAHHLVEGDPLAGILTPLALVKLHRGLGADIELVPIKIGILSGLLDIDENESVVFRRDGRVIRPTPRCGGFHQTTRIQPIVSCFVGSGLLHQISGIILQGLHRRKSRLAFLDDLTGPGGGQACRGRPRVLKVGSPATSASGTTRRSTRHDGTRALGLQQPGLREEQNHDLQNRDHPLGRRPGKG